MTAAAKKQLVTRLVNAPHEFEFDQAFRVLEGLRKDGQPFGETEDPRQEPIYIHSNLSAETPACDIKDIKGKDNWNRAHLTMNIMGLVGHHGPLPQPYSNLLYDQERQRDLAPRDFMDMFNTRVASQWYRVRTKFRQGLSGARPDLSTVGQAVIKLAGLESKHLRNRMLVPDFALIGYAPLFWQRPRSLVGLKQILQDYFGVKAKLKPMLGGWHKTPEYQQSHLAGDYNVLGQDAYLGRRVWLQNSGFEIDLGTLDWQRYCGMLPPHYGFQALSDLIKFYCGFQYRIVMKMHVILNQIPGTRLNRGFQLGRTTWIKGYGNSIGTFRRVISYQDGQFTI